MIYLLKALMAREHPILAY